MKLETFLATNNKSPGWLAEQIGVKQPTVSRYIRNARFPDPEMIERIAVATRNKVTVADWYAQAAEARASKQGAAA